MDKRKDNIASRNISLGTRVKTIQRKTVVIWMSLLLVATGGYYETQYNSEIQLNYVEEGTDQFLMELQDSGKKGLILFYTDYCFPCESMNDHFLKNPELANLVNESFIPYKVDAFDKDAGEILKEKYGILHYPTLLVTDDQGVELERIDLIEDEKEFADRLSILGNGYAIQTVATKVNNKERQPREFLKAPQVTEKEMLSAKESFSLFLETFDSYSVARSAALLRTKLWNKEIWIEEKGDGKYELLLGMFKDQQEGKMAQNYLENWEGVESELRPLNDQPQKY